MQARDIMNPQREPLVKSNLLTMLVTSILSMLVTFGLFNWDESQVQTVATGLIALGSLVWMVISHYRKLTWSQESVSLLTGEAISQAEYLLQLKRLQQSVPDTLKPTLADLIVKAAGGSAGSSDTPEPQPGS